MKRKSVVEVEGSKRSERAVAALLEDLYPPRTAEGTDDGALVEVACAAAAARRLSLLGCFSRATATPAFLLQKQQQQQKRASSTAVVVRAEEPRLRWALGLHTSANPGLRRVSTAATASLRNVLGSLAAIDARVGVGGAGDAEVGGELCLSRVLFADGGRRAAVDAIGKSAATVEAATDAATGTPVVASLGLRVASEDRTTLADVRRRVLAAFASLRAPGPAGTLSAEVVREAVSAGPDAAPSLVLAAAQGRFSTPRLRLTHVLGFDRLGSVDPGQRNATRPGVAACLTSEVGIGNLAEYVRETAAAEARVPLGFGGVVFSLVARAGALLGLRSTEPTPAAAGLEGFAVGPSLVRCIRAKMPSAQGAYRIPVCAFASVAATLAGPIPWVPAVVGSGGRRAGMHAFVDAGGIAHTPNARALLDAAMRRPRVSAGLGFSLPLGPSGRIEFNLALPVARHPQDTSSVFDFNTAPSYLF